MKKHYFIILFLIQLHCAGHLFAQPVCNIQVFPNPAAICKGEAIQLIAVDNGSGGTFTWSPSTGLSPTSGAVVTASPVNNITYKVKKSGCSDSALVLVTVNPIPQVDPIANLTYCNGTTASGIVFHASVNQPSFSWYSKNNLNIGFGINGNDSIPAFFAYNGNANPVVDTIIVHATANDCTGPDVSFAITVSPTPLISQIPGSLTYCNKELIPKIILKSSTSNAVVNWNCDHDIGFGTSGTGNILLDTAAITGTDSITATITVSASLNNCKGPDTSFTITVYPLPQFTSATSESICDNTVFSYTASATPGTKFSWTRSLVPGISNAAASDTTAFINETLDNTTDFPVTVKYAFTLTPAFTTKKPKKCTSADTLYVTIKPTPRIDIVTDKLFCNGETTSHILFSSPSPDSSFFWQSNVNIGFGLLGNDSIPSFAANNSGTTTQTATVTVYAVANGCQGPDSSFTISIVPGPVLTSSTIRSVCNGDTLFYEAIPNIAGAGIIWNRNADAFGNSQPESGNDTINEILKNTNDSAIIVNYYFKLTNGACVGYDTLHVTVYPAPILNSALSDTTCDSVLFVYQAKSATPGTVFSWTRDVIPGISNSADSGSTELIQETLDNTTADTVSVTYHFTLAANGCSANHEDIAVLVAPTPVLNNPVLHDTMCNDMIFKDTVTSNTPGTLFYWERDTVAGITPLANSDADSIIIDSLHNATSNPIDVVYAITLQEPNGCPYTQSLIVTVYPTPALNTTLDTASCSNASFVYQAGSATTLATLSWIRDSVPGIGNSPAIGNSGLINEVLTNTTDTAVIVTYLINLKIGNCTYQQSVTDTVNPVLHLSSALSAAVCNGSIFNYNALSPNAKYFSWTRDADAFGNSANSSDTSVVNEALHNTSVDPIVVTYKFTLTTSDSLCSNTEFVNVTVNPTPKVDTVADKFYCHGDSVAAITLTSQTPGAVLSWTCSDPIGLFPMTGTGSIPAFEAANAGTSPIEATITVSIIVSDSCEGPPLSFKITVNPIPKIISATDTSICSGNSLNYSITPNFETGVVYSWTSHALPVVTGNTDQVFESPNHLISDTLKNSLNNATIPVTYNISIIYNDISKSCKSDTVLTVNVNPSPPKPLFTSLPTANDTVTLCAGSENINFNVIVPNSSNGISYQWSAMPSSGSDIRNTTNPNTVISFNGAGTYKINVVAFNSSALGGCPDSASQIVIVNASNDSIDERKIIMKQPGSLLVYPDNSMARDSGYQWGYDLKINDSTLGPPQNILNQVYQVFIPESKYLNGNQLDTITYAFWIFLKNGECSSKVYYNGPYAPKKLAADNISDNTAGVAVYPNPSQGNFNFSVFGNIYGNIETTVYNTLGEIIYRTVFEKKTSETTQTIEQLYLPDGMYLLELNSSDHRRLTARIIISN